MTSSKAIYLGLLALYGGYSAVVNVQFVRSGDV